MKYYKVLSDQLTSCYARKEGISVQYKIGEFVTPLIEGTGLLVFDNVSDAKYFKVNSLSYDDLVIFECECEEELPLPYWASFNDIDQIKKVWSDEKTGFQFPEGSCAFKKVKILKRYEI